MRRPKIVPDVMIVRWHDGQPDAAGNVRRRRPRNRAGAGRGRRSQRHRAARGRLHDGARLARRAGARPSRECLRHGGRGAL